MTTPPRDRQPDNRGDFVGATRSRSANDGGSLLTAAPPPGPLPWTRSVIDVGLREEQPSAGCDLNRPEASSSTRCSDTPAKPRFRPLRPVRLTQRTPQPEQVIQRSPHADPCVPPVRQHIHMQIRQRSLPSACRRSDADNPLPQIRLSLQPRIRRSRLIDHRLQRLDRLRIRLDHHQALGLRERPLQLLRRLGRRLRVRPGHRIEDLLRGGKIFPWTAARGALADLGRQLRLRPRRLRPARRTPCRPRRSPWKPGPSSPSSPRAS